MRQRSLIFSWIKPYCEAIPAMNVPVLLLYSNAINKKSYLEPMGYVFSEFHEV